MDPRISDKSRDALAHRNMAYSGRFGLENEDSALPALDRWIPPARSDGASRQHPEHLPTLGRKATTTPSLPGPLAFRLLPVQGRSDRFFPAPLRQGCLDGWKLKKGGDDRHSSAFPSATVVAFSLSCRRSFLVCHGVRVHRRWCTGPVSAGRATADFIDS